MTKISTINSIAKKVISNVNKNQKLPSVDKYTKEEYAYLLAKSITKPGKDITKKTGVGKAPAPEGTSISRSIDKADYIKLAKYIVKFINDNKRLPNYVQYKTYKIKPKVFIYAFAKIVNFYAENKKMPSYCNFNSKVYQKAAPVSNDEVFNYFVKKFGTVKTFDEALAKVKDKGYSYYYDDKYSNKTSIDRIYNKWGTNCTDSCQVFWHIAKALGYEVRCMHVQCSSGGHVRLQIKHKTRTNGKWVNRDPAAVISANGKPLDYIWCSGAKLNAVDPKWFLENVNR